MNDRCKLLGMAIISLLLGASSLNARTDGEAISLIVVVGAGGLPKYESQFRTWANRWEELGEEIEASVTVIGTRDDSKDADDLTLLRAAIKNQLKPSSAPLLLVFLGHGTHAQNVAKFNLRGPDLSSAELSSLVADSPRPIAVIQCSSSSVAFLKDLSGPDRTIITATRSNAEQNFSRFGDFFSASLMDASADLDHDNAISVLESFLFAANQVARFYDQEARLATEHSLIDDNGDGLGTPPTFFRGIRAEKAARDGSPLDGIRAHQIILFRLPEHTTLPATAIEQRDQIERDIEALRTRKSEMNRDQYYEQLEELLVSLSRLYAAHVD